MSFPKDHRQYFDEIREMHSTRYSIYIRLQKKVMVSYVWRTRMDPVE
jgi:hypothetical protein